MASSEEAPKEAESSAKGEQSSAIGHVKKGASLRYRLAGTNEDITKWGMEFMK